MAFFLLRGGVGGVGFERDHFEWNSERLAGEVRGGARSVSSDNL